MSVEGESLSFHEEVPGTHDVDPAEVDWQEIREAWADSDGMLNASSRVDVIGRAVDGITSSTQAESLLTEAADRGFIEERGGDYYIETQAEESVTADQVDWEHVFKEVAGGIDRPLPSSARGLQIAMNTDLAGENEGLEAFEDAKEKGIIVLTKRDDDEVRKAYLADGLEQASSAASGMEETAAGDDGGQQTRPELEALREESDDLEEYVGQLEGLLTNVLDRLEAVEERQENQDERFNEYVKEKNEQQRVGLSELQIRRLREGDMLSTDGVDMEVLRDEFGDDLVEVSGGSAVRLAEPKVDEDTSRSTELPDFEDYCELEAERLKLHLQLRTPEDVKGDGIYKYRCLTVWSNAETLATSNDEFPGKMVITKGQVESWIMKHARNGAKQSSMDTVCNRVMDEMADRTDGVIEKKIRNGNSVLVFETDDLEEARCPRFQSRSLDGEDGSDLITPLL